MRNKNVSTAENKYFFAPFCHVQKLFRQQTSKKGNRKGKIHCISSVKKMKTDRGRKRMKKKILFFFFPADGEKRFASHLGMQRKPPSGLLFSSKDDSNLSWAIKSCLSFPKLSFCHLAPGIFFLSFS